MMLSLALRYSFSRSNRHRRRAFRIVLTTALSTAVLLTVISIMNYLQGSRIERIRDVRSFDAVVEGDRRDELSIRFPSASVFLYAEEDALIGERAYTIRFIDNEYDGGIEVIGDVSGMVVPYSYPSSEVSAMMLARGQSGAALPREQRFSVTGRYYSALGYEFDSTHMFLPLSLYGGQDIFTAVKGIEDRDAKALERDGYDIRTWKESEAGLYSALMIEKTMMYLVLSLLFVVILVSLASSIRTFMAAKRGERAELEILGLGRFKINLSFIMSFLIILLSGLLLGAVLSLALMPAAESFMMMLGMDAELSFSVPTFLVLSFLLISISTLLAASEERKEEKMSIMEVLFDE